MIYRSGYVLMPIRLDHENGLFVPVGKVPVRAFFLCWVTMDHIIEKTEMALFIFVRVILPFEKEKKHKV